MCIHAFYVVIQAIQNVFQKPKQGILTFATFIEMEILLFISKNNLNNIYKQL
jgi:hypothetical protein